MTDPISASGKAPLDIEVWAADAARTALQTSFICNNDPVLLKSVYVGRAEVQTRLNLAFFSTYCMVDDTNVRILVDAKTVQEEFVFNLCRHLTLLQPSHINFAILARGIAFRILFQIALCFSFLGIPSTVSISLAAKPFNPGRVVKSS